MRKLPRALREFPKDSRQRCRAPGSRSLLYQCGALCFHFSPQLPFAVLPILTFTSMPAVMQEFANGL